MMQKNIGKGTGERKTLLCQVIDGDVVMVYRGTHLILTVTVHK